MKDINLVKKLISLLLISVCLGDTLILKDKTEYTGTLIKFGNDEIMFRALPSAKLSINISDIQELKLSDGTRVFENGIIVATNEKHIKNIRDGSYLSTIQAEKAKQKSNYKIDELIIKNMNDNGYKKRNSETEKPIKNSTLRKNATICCSIIIILGLIVYLTLEVDLGFSLGEGFEG